MKKLILFLCFLITFLLSTGQTTIYLEDFNGQQGKGATGATPTVDLSGVTWDIDFSSANLSNNYRFRARNVSGEPIFEARNVGNSIWLSPVIDISTYTDVAFTIDASQGGNNLDNSDTLTTQYRINETGSWINANTNGSLTNDYGNVEISQTMLNGATLEIRVISVNNANNERHRFDNVEVTGIEICSTPVNPTIFNATNSSNASIVLNWNLDSCNEEYLIIAKDGSAVTATPTGDGTSYSADSNFGTGTEIATDEFIVYKGNLDTETISNYIFGNTYHFAIFARNDTTWSSGVQINYTLDYCTSIGTRDTYDTNTTLVSFGDINNNTVVDDGAPYHDYTALSHSIEIGASDDLIVNIDTDDFGGNTFSVYCYVWIDWNRDGDFEDTGETYDLGFAVGTDNGPTSNSPLSITAPNDAELGDTRMRVVSEYYFDTIPTNGPCDGAADGEVEDYTVTILPFNTYIYDNGWSPSDPNGVATPLNNILVVAGTANFNTNTNCNNFIVNPEGSVTIDSGVSLTVDNEMILESTSTQYSSLISDGNINGSVNYRRHVNIAAGAGTSTTANDLISAPLTGQTFGDFRANNPNILSGTIGGSPAFLFGPFNPATESYINYSPSDDASTLNAGNGYRTGSTDNATYTFTGTVETGNVSAPIVSSSTSNWNLIGNPYPSYLIVQDFLNNSSNTSLINENAVGIYGYDGAATDGWTIYNLATTTSSTVITPGQGFFVNAKTSGNIQFTPSMRTTGTDDDFIAGRMANNPLVFLKLNVSNATKNFTTDFYFNDNASLSLDVGYDATVWNTIPPSFSIYSHLVTDNTGEAMALQALHTNDLFNVTIPLGVNADNSSDILFSISASTIPNDVNVYLEDTVENTLTLLTEEDYVLTSNSALNGTGRFYLRFVANQLDLNEIELETLNIFANHSEKTIVIEGLLQEETNFQLYDIQGRLVSNSILQLNSNRQSIDVSYLTTGIYIVQLQSKVGNKTKKIILR